MNTLSITDILKNFAFYEARYAQIIHSAEYFTEVSLSSSNQVQPVYLGDLLILWLSGKWRISQTILSSWNQFLGDIHAVQKDELYLLSIEQPNLWSSTTVKAWSVSRQTIVDIQLEHAVLYALYAKLIRFSRPKLINQFA